MLPHVPPFTSLFEDLDVMFSNGASGTTRREESKSCNKTVKKNGITGSVEKT